MFNEPHEIVIWQKQGLLNLIYLIHLIIMIFDLHTFIQTIPNCHMMEIKKIEFPNDYCLNSANWRILKIFTIETLQTPPVVLVSAPLGRWAYIVKIRLLGVAFISYNFESYFGFSYHIKTSNVRLCFISDFGKEQLTMQHESPPNT